MIEILIKLIEDCNKCEIVDKPFVKYRVYEKYLPNKVETLVISESPPPGFKNDFIYNIEHFDRLRQVLSKIFNISEREIVEFLKSNGIFWTTAIKCRPKRKKNLEMMRRNCLEVLRSEIECLNPSKIIVLGKIAWKSINDLKIENVSILRHYHPLYLARFKKTRLTELRELFFK